MGVGSSPDPAADSGVADPEEPDEPDDSDELPEDDRPRFVRFAVGDRSFLIAVGAVQEVLVAEPCTRLPGAPGAVLGVINVRGRIVAVVDPRPALHPTAPEPDGAGRFLVVATPRGPVGLRVDRVADVVPGEPVAVAPSADQLDPPAADGPGPVVEATVTILDVELDVVDPVALVAAAVGLVDAAGAR